MTSEAVQFARAFDRIGHDVLKVLAQCDGIPASILHWPLPLPQADSLFMRAMRLVEESEFWVLVIVGGQPRADDNHSKEHSTGSLPDLVTRYRRWLAAIHQVLDELPDAKLDLFIIVPPSSRDIFGDGLTTIRDCLLYALGRSALQAGHIQFVCQLFADGERVLHEVAEQGARDESYPVAFPSTM